MSMMQSEKIETEAKPMQYANIDRLDKEDKDLEDLENARDAQNAELEDTQRDEEETDQLSAEEKTFKQRYGDLRRHQAKQAKDHNDSISELKVQIESLSKKQMKFPKTDEEVDAWYKEYPDVAQIVETISRKMVAESSTDFDQRFEQVKKDQQDVARERAEVNLAKIHPDYDDLRNDQEFHDWGAEQPKWIQSALYENEDDFMAVSKVIDLYKLEKGVKSKSSKSSREDSSKEAAKHVGKAGRGKDLNAEQRSGWSESRVQKLSDRDFEKYVEEITASQANGTFVYDLSGGAR